MILRFIIFLGLATTLLMSCQHDPFMDDMTDINDPGDTTGTGGNGKPCDEDTVYFVNDILPIIKSSCAVSGCHGQGSAQDGVDLSDYSSIIRTGDVRAFNRRGSDLYEVITDDDPDDRMPQPPYNPLTSEQIELIGKWIDQGALNNSCENCATDNVTFSEIIFPLIQRNCIACHRDQNPIGGLSLANYQAIKVQADNGALLGSVTASSGYTPMPYNQSSLPDCNIDQIQIWISEGALNN